MTVNGIDGRAYRYSVFFAIQGAITTGLAVGADVDLIAFLTARHFPKQLFAEVNGVLYAPFLVGVTVGCVLSGALYDLNGEYHVSFLVAATLLTIAATAVFRQFNSASLGREARRAGRACATSLGTMASG